MSSAKGAGKALFVLFAQIDRASERPRIALRPSGASIFDIEVWSMIKAVAPILTVLLGSMVWISFVFFLLWNHYGRDPEKGAVNPHFDPPEGLSPAGARYLLKRRLDTRGLVAAIVSMAIKGVVRIRCDGAQGEGRKCTYWLERRDDGKKNLLSEDEGRIFEALMGYSIGKIELGKNAVRELSEAFGSAQASLKRQYGSLYHRNIRVGVAGILMTFFPLAVALHALGDPNTARLLLTITALSAAITGLFGTLLEHFLSSTSGAARWLFLLALVALLGCGGWEVLRTMALFSAIRPLSFTLSLLNGLIPAVFILLMGAPTEEGQKLRDRLDGLALYIVAAEKDYMNLTNPPDRTSEFFEGLLPYALALGLEQPWGEGFAEALSPYAAESAEDYRASWYGGAVKLNLHSLSSFSSEMVDLISSTRAESSGGPVF